MSDKKFNVGDKVKYIGEGHESNPEWYPLTGTIGYIKSMAETNVWVKWPDGSTSMNDYWCCSLNDIERVVEGTTNDMTNEEIWKMLEPKMKKNGLKTKVSITHIPAAWRGESLPETCKTYYEDDVHNAIAIAYRSGYERAMKGRPFKFGEKKKKGGHWEAVDPKNLPKEGTKVRYSRECEHYVSAPEMITLGDIGEFGYSRILNLPGIRFDDDRYWDWVSFSNNALECLDMWVEDDE